MRRTLNILKGKSMMKKVSKLLTVFLAFGMLVLGFAQVAEAAAGKEINSSVVERLQGLDRVETSIKVSNEVYPTGSAENVVLAGWNGQVDALTATLLASVKDGPLLLVTDSQYSKIKNELNRLGVKNVYLAGGTTVVSAQFEKNLKKDGYQVKRLSGANRYATAAEVMKAAGVNSNHVFLVNGGAEKVDQLADALAVGPVSGRDKLPILLTGKDQLPQATSDALKGVDQITIVGGHAAVSEKVAKQLKGQGYKVDRVEGPDRYQTAVEVSKKYFTSSTKAILVNDGRVSFADALVGGYLGAKKGAPVLLTNATQLTGQTKGYVEGHTSLAYVLGGIKSIGSSVFNQVDTAIIHRGKRSIQSVETFDDVQVDFGGKYRLPEKVEVSLSDQTAVTVPVEWSAGSVNVNASGVYQVEGQLDFTAVKDLQEEAKKKKATISIVVAEKVEVDSEVDKAPFRVVVDYGHGGTDPGAVYKGRQEKDDTLKLGKMVTAKLRSEGILVDETRTGDETVELKDRSAFANRNGRDYYNYFISIHRNSYHLNTAHGAETYVYVTRNPLSVALATNIQKGLVDVGFRNRGVKESNFYVLRATYAPAVLVEVGFMNNDADNKIFDDNLEQIAQSIADAVILQAKK